MLSPEDEERLKVIEANKRHADAAREVFRRDPIENDGSGKGASIERRGNTIFINGDQASVTFNPRSKDKTCEAILNKFAELDKSLVSGSQELADLKATVERELTKIYADYEDEKNSKGKNKPALIENVVQPLPKKLEISKEDWQRGVAERYNNLKSLTERNFPDVWLSVEFLISVARILNIKECTLPFMGIVLGPPSSSKTLGIELFRGTRHTFFTDSFSAKSFVSHASDMNEDQLQQIDLLPRIKDNIFLTPELAPVFSARDEDLMAIFAIITRVLDGQGYESHSGAKGHRGYTGEHMFVWLGAAVEIPRKVHKLLSSLGPKLYFYRLSVKKTQEKDDVDMVLADNFNARRKEVIAAMHDYLDYFDQGPTLEVINGIPKTTWLEDDREAIEYIVRLAKLLAHLRGSVPTWESSDTEGIDYAYSLAIIEQPSRAMTQLRNLARGRALSEGRTSITIDDMKIVVKVVLSTAPIERVSIFDLLLAHNGNLKTSDITAGLNTSNPTAKRTMAELKALGLVDAMHEGNEWKITLKSEFSWFLTEEFKELREGFKPTDNRESMKAADDRSNNGERGG